MRGKSGVFVLSLLLLIVSTNINTIKLLGSIQQQTTTTALLVDEKEKKRKQKHNHEE